MTCAVVQRLVICYLWNNSFFSVLRSPILSLHSGILLVSPSFPFSGSFGHDATMDIYVESIPEESQRSDVRSSFLKRLN